MKEHKIKAKQKKKHKSFPLRQPATNTIYDFIMRQKKPKRFNQYVWSRNQIAITLLFNLIFRVNKEFQKEVFALLSSICSQLGEIQASF